MDFPANSHKAKDAPITEPKKKVDPIQLTGTAQRRKPSLGKRFAETFGGGDARGVGSYILLDVLLPAAKDMVSDAVSQGIDRILFGEARSSSRRGRTVGGSNTGFISYNKMSQRSVREEPTRLSRQGRSNHKFDEILLATRAEAEEVIGRLNDLIEQYDVATVADMYTLVDISPEFTDGKWGWDDLNDARVERTRDGYLLDLPKPNPVP